MSLKLMYITNNKQIAKIAQNCEVDWIFVDIERLGKEKRQMNMDTVKSTHTLDDVKNMRKIVDRSELVVRINPINSNSKREIDEVIDSGADIIMLPYFKDALEVERFLSFVNGRIKTCLLFETPESKNKIDSILKIGKVDYVHIGLNDLHLAYNLNFMFELLVNGVVEDFCTEFRKRNITFGIGGIARIGEGILPAEKIIIEHYRLGSEMVILSRSFCNMNSLYDIEKIEKIFIRGVNEIRNFENFLKSKDEEFFLKNRVYLCNRINEILNGIAR